jgi:hypothetical protein
MVPAAGGFCWRSGNQRCLRKGCVNAVHWQALTFIFMSLGPVTDEHGTTRWYDGGGKCHRDGDLPAVMYADGTQVWYQHGNKHRDGDLPAVVWENGSQRWYKHGKLHRSFDLPAAVWPDGTQWWYHHGECHRDGDLPAVVEPDGTQFWYLWYQHGEPHRSFDLPAVVWPDGRQEWWVDGRLQSDCDRERTRAVMAQAARWSPLRAAFVGAVAANAVCARDV